MEHNSVPFVRNKTIGAILSVIFLLLITSFLFISILDTDKTVSTTENRKLATFPEVSFATVFSGEFMTDFEEYYSDTFPFRDIFLNVNNYITKYTSQFTAGDDSIVIIDTNKSEEDFAGESLGEVSKGGD